MICKTDAPTRVSRAEGWVQANFGGMHRCRRAGRRCWIRRSARTELHFPLLHEKRDFLDAVSSRGQTLEDAEVGHRTASLGHLGQIAIQLGRTLKFDPDKELFPGDDEANKYLGRHPAEPRAL